jgi:hypothetical protein
MDIPPPFFQRRTPMAWGQNDKFGMFALTAATEIELTLDKRYSYKFVHTGDDAGGNDDANSAKSAWLSTASATITADGSVEDNKYELVTDTDETIGPGIEKLYVVSTSGADAVIHIIRKLPCTTSY